MKAGLMPDAWLDRDSEIWRFSAEVFGEGEPRGRPGRVRLA
jgi:AMMECR1 domain-containing protein